MLLSILSILIIGTGCSGTWDGVKNDSGKAWDSTKETIHEATK
ncbi:entericidin EcnAB [Sulfurimonas sp.]